jgi:hypothetical protein
MPATFSLVFAALLVTASAAAASPPEEDQRRTACPAIIEGRHWRRLLGAWVGDYSPIQQIVFTSRPAKDHNWYRFFAYFDNNVRCIKAPCQSGELVEGSYAADDSTMSLRPDQTPRRPAAECYEYRIVKQARRTDITARHEGGVTTFLRLSSFCRTGSDCEEQGLTHAQCAGSWTCTARSRCRYVCAAPRSR